jgi:hypothetical protein
LISGYNHHATNTTLYDLTNRQWLQVLHELGFVEVRRRRAHREAAGEITQALRAAFGEPRVAVLAEWEERSTPRSVLDALAQRTWSLTWEIPDDVLHPAVQRLETLAREQFDDLDAPIMHESQFKIELYTRN